MKKTLLSIVLLSVLCTSCASIVNGTTQLVGIQSDPSMADVFVDYCYVGKTPIQIKLTRKNDHTVKIELPGYCPYEINFDRHVSGWVFGNLVFGGVVGIAIDAVDGAMYQLTPRQAMAVTGQDSLAHLKLDKAFVSVVLKADPEWEKVGELSALTDEGERENSTYN